MPRYLILLALVGCADPIAPATPLFVLGNPCVDDPSVCNVAPPPSPLPQACHLVAVDTGGVLTLNISC